MHLRRKSQVLQKNGHSRSDRKAVALDLVSVSDYEWQVRLAAKGLAERDKHPMPTSATTPEAFYEVMAAAALDAIGLPALQERVTRAERDLELIQDALRLADTKAKSARHRARTDEASSESSIALILRGSGMSPGPEGVRTHNPHPSPLPRDPEQRDIVGEGRRLSTVPSPLNRSEETKPPPPSWQPPNRTARSPRKALERLLALVRIRVRSTA